jgi:pyruvate dehydrogenase E2 component (dihydrolipoamide acetyltransferase)
MADPTPIPQGQGPQGQGPANQQLQVKVPDEMQKGTYANAVSVNVNSNEVVVDFGYLLPNTPAPVIEVVSRVNMNHKTAESFLSVLGGAMDDFKKKQEAADAAPPAAPAAAPVPAPMPAPAPVAPAPALAPMPAPAPAAPAPGAPTMPPPPLPN